MEIKYLLDTNIFLEILLDRDKRKSCEEILNKKIGEISLTDFSLHSIGVILFKSGQERLYKQFLDDVLFKVNVLSLPQALLDDVIRYGKMYKFDFDDAYQYSVASNYQLQIVTLDKDFEVLNKSEVLFL